jgi:hypothetical protein
MNKLLITTATMAMLSTGAMAADLGGEMTMTFAENAAEDWAGTMALDLDVSAGDAATLDLGFTTSEGNAVVLDTWVLGTPVAGANIEVGNDLDAWVGAEGEHTIALPNQSQTGIAVSANGVKVAVGLTDWETDVTDVNNIQGSYTTSISNLGLTAAVDYDMDSEDLTYGGRVEASLLGNAVGGTGTYDPTAEHFAYEVDTSLALSTSMNVMAYLNGDQDEMAQNLGGEVTYNLLAGVELGAAVNYDIVNEDTVPSVTATFAF